MQLYHKRDAGSYDDPQSYRAFWDVDTVWDELGTPYVRKVERGPLFSKSGSPRRDWDPFERVPIFVATLDATFQGYDGEPLSTEDVFSGKVVLTIRRWMDSITRRSFAAAKEKGREVRRRADDISEAITDTIWHEANKHDADYTPIAKKHQAQDAGVQRMHKQLDRQGELEDVFLPPTPPGGVPT